MRKITITTLGLALTCLLAFAVRAQAQPVTTTSGELPHHAGQLWGKIKTEGNESASGVSVVVHEVSSEGISGPVAVGVTDKTGAYSINISSLPQGKYMVEIIPGQRMVGGYLGGQTMTILRGPTASKHIDWTLYGTQSAMPFARWTKVPATPAPQ